MNHFRFFSIFLSVLFCAQLSTAQEVVFPTNEAGNVVYEGVIVVDSVSKESLYNKAIDWFVMTYNSSNDVLQLKDEDRAKLIGKGTLIVYYWMENEWLVKHTITIQTKDGRLKYQINQITFHAPNMKGACSGTFSMDGVGNKCLPKKHFYKLKVEAHNKILALIQSLTIHLKTSQDEGSDDDW